MKADSEPNSSQVINQDGLAQSWDCSTVCSNTSQECDVNNIILRLPIELEPHGSWILNIKHVLNLRFHVGLPPTRNTAYFYSTPFFQHPYHLLSPDFTHNLIISPFFLLLNAAKAKTASLQRSFCVFHLKSRLTTRVFVRSRVTVKLKMFSCQRCPTCQKSVNTFPRIIA